MVDQIKYQPNYAERAYDEILPASTSAALPEQKYMDVFWQIAVEGGTVKEPWPNAKLLDDRFIKSFAEWAP